MKALFGIVFLSFGIVATPVGFANWQDWSVWDKMKVEQYLVRGKVKAIAVDEINDQLVVKIKTIDADGLANQEVVKICTGGIQSLHNQHKPNPQLDLIRTALATGQVIELSYHSNYDRCINTVTYVAPESSKKAQTSSAPVHKIKEI